MGADDRKFFVLPVTRYRPEDIPLGQIIKDWKDPYIGLFTENTIKNTLLEGLTLKQPSGLSTWSTVVTLRKIQSASLTVRALENFSLHLLGHRLAEEFIEASALRLETREFEPLHADNGDKYVERLNQSEEFRSKVSRRDTVYVITGVMVAICPEEVVNSTATEAGVAAGAGTTLDPDGAVAAEAQVERTNAGAVEQRGIPEHDFVFAYRVREVKLTWLGGKAKVGEHRGGGHLHSDKIKEAIPRGLAVSDDEDDSSDGTDDVVTDLDEGRVESIEKRDFVRDSLQLHKLDGGDEDCWLME